MGTARQRDEHSGRADVPDVASSVLPEGASLRLHRVGQWIAATFVRWPYRVRIHHGERVPASGGIVLVANHSSLLEGPLLFGMLTRSAVFLIKHELFRGPLGWFLRRIGQLAVRRGEPDRAPLLAAVRVLREGGLVGVFPAGTRGDGGAGTVQDGAAWLARCANARVLPVAVRGTSRPKGSRRRFLPRVDVLFGEPLDLRAAKGKAGLTEATAKVQAELDALIDDLEKMTTDNADRGREGEGSGSE